MSALRKVLVVDDDPVVGRSFDRVLSNKGYTVITAHNAADALERLRREEVDLVFTDIRMPGMDGLELAEKVKARRPWTPVVIVTGYGTAAAEQRAHAAGVSAFLHKPLSPDMIEDSTADALRDAPMASLAAEAAAEAHAQLPVDTSVEPVAAESRLKNIALFFAAPFIGLAYAVFMPVVGLGVALWFGTRALMNTAALSRLRSGLALVGKALSTPFIGLAFVIVLPFAGLAALAWIGAKALLTKRQVE